jgi:serine/threonine protein kinase
VSGHVKIIDFGLCREASDEVTATGSLIYMPPELITLKIGGEFTDWWAIGVLTYELLTGRSPWSSLSDNRVIRREIRSLKVALPKFSKGACHLVDGLLQKNHLVRLGTKSQNEESHILDV